MSAGLRSYTPIVLCHCGGIYIHRYIYNMCVSPDTGTEQGHVPWFSVNLPELECIAAFTKEASRVFLIRAECPCEPCFLCKVDFKDSRDSAAVCVSTSTSSCIVNVETEQPAMKKQK